MRPHVFTLLASASIGMAMVATPHQSSAQWVEKPAPTTASMRGLSVVNKDVIWTSGTKGTYVWTADGGAHWTVGTVPGAESFDFRDVHAVSLDTAYLMAAGQDTARIYKTTDRGKTWTLQYNDTRKGVFLDAIAFWDATHGIALGDPIDGRFMILRTDDGGATWNPIDSAGLPRALTGEAAFAASGTSLVTLSSGGKSYTWFATGGATTSRLFSSQDGGKTWTVSDIPVAANAPSKGTFSIAFWSPTNGIAVGGDYAKPDSTAITVAVTRDGGKTWQTATPSPATGYLSGVTVVGNGDNVQFVAVGTQGTAVSTDGGKTWTQRDQLSLNAVVAVPGSRAVWATGPSGKNVIRPEP